MRGGVVARPYLAINHIRDQLIAPQDRKRKRKLWDKVVLYIRESESRVREEVQVIILFCFVNYNYIIISIQVLQLIGISELIFLLKAPLRIALITVSKLPFPLNEANLRKWDLPKQTKLII
jgi:hypothetical protein